MQVAFELATWICDLEHCSGCEFLLLGVRSFMFFLRKPWSDGCVQLGLLGLEDPVAFTLVRSVFKGRDIQGPRVTDRGSRDKSEDWQVEGNGEGASGHSHELSLFARLVATT